MSRGTDDGLVETETIYNHRRPTIKPTTSEREFVDVIRYLIEKFLIDKNNLFIVD